MTLTSALLTLAMAGIFVVGGDGPLAQRLEGQLLDLRFQLRGATAPAADIALIAIDEKSLQRYGRWPFSRRVYADLVDRLAAVKARTIVFDLLFAEPELNLPPALHDTLAGLAAAAPDSTQRLAMTDLLQRATPDDELAAAFRRAANVIIPLSFRFNPEGSIAGQPKQAAAGGETQTAQQTAQWAFNIVRGDAATITTPLPSAGLLVPVATLADAALGAGHDASVYDVDGGLRYDYAAGGLNGKLYPSLSVRAAAAFLGAPWSNVQIALGHGIAIGGLRVPIDKQNRIIVNYDGPTGTFPTYSLVDVLDGRVPAAALADKLVLIGPTGVGITEFVRTPFAEQLPGIERYASVIDHVLHGGALQKPAWHDAAIFAAILCLGLLVTLTAPRLNLALALAVAAVSLLAWGIICQLVFIRAQLWLNLLFPSATVIVTFASIVLLRGIAEERRRRAAETSLRRSEERYALSARGANDGLWDWDLASGQFYTSPRWHEIVGLGEGQARADIADWYDRVLAADLAALQGAIEAHLAGGTAHLEHEFRLRHADGSEHWMLVRGLKVSDANKRPVRMAGSMTDITSRKQSEQQLLFDARFDRLTGLANRAAFRERADFALQMMASGEPRDFLMAIIDLDRFRDINDSLGLGTGDQLLISIGRSLQQALTGQDTLARLNEDEYGVLRLFEGDSGPAMEDLVATIQQAIARPFVIDQRNIEITASIGIVIASEAEARSAEALISDASLAVYRAKALGRARAIKFDPSMQQTALQRLDLVADLRQALVRGNELELFYQPIMRLKDGGIHGFEALIRWRHPEKGLISPGDFIPLAEETGLIVEIGRRSIWQTCRQIADWQAATGYAPQVAVNVSGRQLETEAIVNDIRLALEETKIQTDRLKIEVTESMVMDNPERTQALLARIVALGVKVSIDDFGTGYSSLSHLHRFPFHTLKIDRSFVIRLTENREGFEICKAIAKLAHILRRDVVAEGVETAAQADHLRNLDVEYGQGYLFAKPLPVADATGFLRQHLGLHDKQAVGA
ncbi:MAG TPA: EAL domain-containing protein [Dongiaceae bacterium]|nr:EAL domain-containing protein [Dongiaceae bacterium]